MEVAVLFLVLAWLVNAVRGVWDINLVVTRQNVGDMFAPEGITRCKPETCVGLSSGTAVAISGGDSCRCQCHSHLPAFREDLRICVDDIHECVLSPFVGGSTVQPIPFVFLPLKGQIIHPSKEINFAGIQTPVCAVSGSKFLTESGWVDLRNPLDSDVPFRLFRDEGRTFLQWAGEPDVRNRMAGRLVLVYLMCRELAATEPPPSKRQTLFSPCVAFRIVGTPSGHLNNVSEVAFSSDSNESSSPSMGHLSVSEYVAIGICSIILGLIYVASVFLYLHIRKRSRSSADTEHDEISIEEGIIKSNPLLTIPHFQAQPDSESASSDTDIAPDLIQQHHEDRRKSTQITSALVHPQYKRSSKTFASISTETNIQDTSSIEKLPEENVSIVETLEGKEERPDGLKAISGTVRRKLYFNPAYFEPQLLAAPPPAALEFLSKIREVITIAKQKMSAKKFNPSLMHIQEEDNNYVLDPPYYEYGHPSISRRNSAISLKRENSRRKTCSGCPGCEPQDFKPLCGKLPEFPSLVACQNCTTTTDSKQRSIRKWLEDVPILKDRDTQVEGVSCVPKRVRSPTRSLPPGGNVPHKALSPRPASERATSPDSEIYKRHRHSTFKFQASKLNDNEHHYDSVPIREMTFPPPDMIHEAMAVDEEIRIPTLTKKQMNAVINELSEIVSLPVPDKKPVFEVDSLERSGTKGFCTPIEYADLSPSQPSPSLSTALPMDEEMTMGNEVFDKKIEKINNDTVSEDDHDYELIVLKKGSLKKQKLYKLPELLHRNKGYSLVSEVYVNNGYNYNSTTSSSDSDSSTLEKPILNVRYEELEQPGKLLIEVEDCPDNYIQVHDSDSFEPDTLDRKPSKVKMTKLETEYTDSLERPQQILLKSNGSFKKETSSDSVQTESNFNRAFGSLREIYEAKTKKTPRSETFQVVEILCDDDVKMLSLEERHSKRQRRAITNVVVPPDVIPPPHTSPIYECPRVVRRIEGEEGVPKPELPPKNGDGRSVSSKSTAADGTPDRLLLHSSLPSTIQLFHPKKRVPDDPGYLSTDSKQCSPDKGSESEESLGDGHSESGAESVETHSVFFGCFRTPNNTVYGSMDSGVDADNGMVADEGTSSDSETVNHTTVMSPNSVAANTTSTIYCPQV